MHQQKTGLKLSFKTVNGCEAVGGFGAPESSICKGKTMKRTLRRREVLMVTALEYRTDFYWYIGIFAFGIFGLYLTWDGEYGRYVTGMIGITALMSVVAIFEFIKLYRKKLIESRKTENDQKQDLPNG